MQRKYLTTTSYQVKLFWAALLGASLIVSSQPARVYAHSIGGDADATIHINQAGYQPRNLTIKQGQTVAFENVDNVALWPASNIHPTHEIYSDFDPGKPVPPGEIWTFTFDQPGIWQYHDHLFPQITGQIIVNATTEQSTTSSVQSTSKASESPTMLERLRGYFKQIIAHLTSRFGTEQNKSTAATSHPYDEAITADNTSIFNDEDALFSYVKKFGPTQTMAHLHRLSSQFGDCHNTAHLTGRFAYELFDRDAFRRCTAECHSGCYHGATEVFFRDHGTANLQESLAVICQADLNSFYEHQCLHGIGHGLMAWANYEIHDALAACDLLATGRESCYTGVFMENIVGTLGQSEGSGHYTSYLSDDPHFPCNVVAEPYQATCYFYQTSRMVQLFQGDFARVAEACAAAPSRFHRHCFESMGRDVGGVHRNQPADAIAACANVPPGPNQQSCLAGAVQDTFWEPSGQDTARQFCELVSDQTAKDLCYQTIFSRAAFVLPNFDDIGTFCQTIEPNYRSRCQDTLPNGQ